MIIQFDPIIILDEVVYPPYHFWLVTSKNYSIAFSRSYLVEPLNVMSTSLLISTIILGSKSIGSSSAIMKLVLFILFALLPLLTCLHISVVLLQCCILLLILQRALLPSLSCNCLVPNFWYILHLSNKASKHIDVFWFLVINLR